MTRYLVRYIHLAVGVDLFLCLALSFLSMWEDWLVLPAIVTWVLLYPLLRWYERVTRSRTEVVTSTYYPNARCVGEKKGEEGGYLQ